MKSALIHVLCLLCAICVFGDADNVETISLKEGGSVTLLTGVPEIQSSDVIVWRFNGTRIAQISDGTPRTEGSFSDRLKMDNQTGNLKITNIKTTDSGEYKLKITSTRSSEKTFSVSVSADEVMDVSVLVGDTVTLHTGLTKAQIYDAMQWTFGHLNSPIAEISRAAGIFSTNDGPDGRFKDRLKLDCLTGSLTITDIRTKHSGLYEVDISVIGSISTYIIHKSFSVTVSGLSAGAVMGICGAVLLVLGAGAVVAAVIYHRRRISELKSLKLQMLWATEGESVALTGTEIREADSVQWKFRDTLIAERKAANGEFTVHDDHDGIFKGRLQLEKDSLIITNTSSDMFGDYELRILRRGHEILKTFIVTVLAETGETPMKIVMEGESFTLPSYVTGTQTDDQLEWKFKYEDSPIAQIKGGIPKCFPSAAGGRFGDRLMLNKNGSLTITNTKTTDTGVYGLYNTESGHKLITSFNVVVLYPKYFKNNPEEEPLTGVGVCDSCL